MSTQIIPFDPSQLPNYSNLTPAQNAQITAILRAHGILSPVYSSPCDPAYIATVPAANQAYAQSLCDQGQAGYNIGNALMTQNTAQLEQGVVQLPASVGAIAAAVAQPGVDLWNSITSLPSWLWIALATVGAIVLVDLV